MILFYDSKKGEWQMCCYKLPFCANKANAIMMKGRNGKKYLHFIGKSGHFEIELGEQRVHDQSWQIERLLWIGYYKNSCNSRKSSHSQNFKHLIQKMSRTNNCMFAALPKDIIKFMLTFVNHQSLVFPFLMINNGQIECKTSAKLCNLTR